MWMQKSMEGTSINSHTNFSNRQGGNFSQSSYGGGSSNSGNSGDWKSKILESGQWIGGKVIKYGGKLARGNSHDAIPDSYSHQPRNDGRANWMADIRNSSSSFQGGYNRTPSNTYQNDFATERPPAYSDYSNKPASSYVPSSRESRSYSHYSSHKDRNSKKKVLSKIKKSKKYDSSHSEFESDDASDLDFSNSSDNSHSDRSIERTSKVKLKKKQKSKVKKKSKLSSASDQSDDEPKQSRPKPQKPPADYNFSFDASKLPPPPLSSDETTKRSKSSKSKKYSKSRRRKYSVESSDSHAQPTSDKENRMVKTKGKKEAKNVDVDLLGVETMSEACAPCSTSVFDSNFASVSNPIQDLAGLSFPAPYSQAPVSAPTIFSTPAPKSVSKIEEVAAVFTSSLLPENNIVDLQSLASEKKPEKKNPEEKLSLNDMQRSKCTEPPTPVMPLNAQMAAKAMQPPSGMPVNPMGMNPMSQMQIQVQMGGTNPMMQRMQGASMPGYSQFGGMPNQHQYSHGHMGGFQYQ